MTEFNWSGVNAALKSTIESVDGIFVVHPAPKFDKQMQPSRWRKLLTPLSSPIINAWAIHRTGVSTSWLTCNEVRVLHAVTLTGFYEHNDENDSQAVFERIIDDLMFLLFGRIYLDGKAMLQGTAQLVTNDFQIVAGTLVHFAEITTLVEQRIKIPAVS